jgi:formylglycine-generating enzyme required for sulfatase activity
MRTRARHFLGSLALVAALCSGCGDDQPAAPATTATLQDLRLSLEVESTSIELWETVTARVVSPNATPEQLAALQYAWGWRPEFTYYTESQGLSQALLQFPSAGLQRILVRVSDAEDAVELSVSVTVALPPVTDGSLDMIAIPAGAFVRGNKPEETGFSSFTPQRTITLSSFSLARTEVTNATFAAAVNWAAARGLVVGFDDSPVVYLPPAPGDDRWVHVLDLRYTDLDWTGAGVAVAAGKELHPATGMTWAGAASVCNWLSEMHGLTPCYTFTPTSSLHIYDVTCDFSKTGYRLPTEAEWEKAARGGEVLPSGANPLPDRAFPWGNEPIRVELVFGFQGSTRANTADRWLAPLRYQGPLFGAALPVGAFPAGSGPYGHADLIGNVAEYCNDWHGWNYYAEAPDTDPRGTDEFYPTVEDNKIVRGDSWDGARIPALAAFTLEEGCAKRRWTPYRSYSHERGFRVARTGL